MATNDKGQVSSSISDAELVDYCVDHFNLIRETVKIDWDDEGECMITGQYNGTVEFISISGTLGWGS